MEYNLDEFWEQFAQAENSGRFATALQLISKICKMNDDPFYQINRGRAFYNLRQLMEAEEIVLANYSESHTYRDHTEVLLGRICESAGRFAKAEQWYRKATESKPAAMRNWTYLASFLGDAGRLSEACEAHREGLHRCGSKLRDEAFLNLGRTLRSLGDYFGAIQCFKEALRISPGFEVAQNDLNDTQEAQRLQNEFRETP